MPVFPFLFSFFLLLIAQALHSITRGFRSPFASAFLSTEGLRELVRMLIVVSAQNLVSLEFCTCVYFVASSS